MGKGITLKSGDKSVEITKDGDEYKLTVTTHSLLEIMARIVNPPRYASESITLSQEQIEQLATHLNNQHTSSFPRGNIDFGTSME
mgnify:CR=1 FL=1|tara:strand:+ start:16436 stop:16690 length:255 start_codon:yes stop_codon:yes gene_type:complete